MKEGFQRFEGEGLVMFFLYDIDASSVNLDDRVCHMSGFKPLKNLMFVVFLDVADLSCLLVEVGEHIVIMDPIAHKIPDRLERGFRWGASCCGACWHKCIVHLPFWLELWFDSGNSYAHRI